MGVRDAEEMLEAAQAQSLADERTIAALQAQLDAIARVVAAPFPWDETRADDCEARTARAYNRALANVGAILDRTEKETP